MKRMNKIVSIITLFAILAATCMPVTETFAAVEDSGDPNDVMEQTEEDNEKKQLEGDNPDEETEDLNNNSDLYEKSENDLVEPMMSLTESAVNDANTQQAANADELQARISAVPENGELHIIEITDDIDLDTSISIQNQQNIMICSEFSSVFTIYNESNNERHFEVSGTLILSDIVLDGKNSLGGVIVDDGTLKLNDGAVIENCFATAYNGGGIYAENSHVEINGGIIRNNQAQQSGGGIYAGDNSEVVLITGSIQGNSVISDGGGGGGIDIYANSTLIMYGGQITDNKTFLSGVHSVGGGVRLNGTFNLYEGVISGNESVAYGGGVSMNVGSVMDMKGGEISDNTVKRLNSNQLTPCGGGVYLGGGATFNMNDGEIARNKSEYGGGVCVGYPTGTVSDIFNFNGGSIRANEATTFGGGVFVQYALSIVNLNGGTIGGPDPGDGNTAANGGGVFSRGSTVNIKDTQIIGNIASGAGGGIYQLSGEITMIGGVILENKAPTGGGIYSLVENSSNPCILKISGGEIKDNEATTSVGGGICLQKNIAANISVDATISGGTIQGNTAKTFGGGIYTNTGAVLPISNTQIDGNSAVNSGGGGICLDSSGLELSDNTSITNNQSAQGGGGIYSTGSTIDMIDANIKNNEAIGRGGGIYAAQYSSLTIRDGVISSNEGSYGGGLYLDENSMATMTGGTIGSAIEGEGNQVNNYGGGICVYENSKFVLDGGSIEGNKRIYNTAGGGGGGGVHVLNNSTFELKSGAIKNNEVHDEWSYGGGIMVGVMVFASNDPPLPPCTFIMSGGSIEGNTCLGYGGGVAVVGNGKFIMTDGMIKENHAITKFGGGVYIGNAFANTIILFSMRGGTISDNDAPIGGGVMLITYDYENRIVQFDMDGGLISSNKSTDRYGGGVCAVYPNSIFNMGQNWDSSSPIPTIEGNTAQTEGGGIYLFNPQAHIYNGVVKDNSAKTSGGGIFLAEQSVLPVSNGQISGNVASVHGGGVYVNDAAQFTTNSGVSLTGNTAGSEGGGIYTKKYITYAEDMDVDQDYSNLTIHSDTIFRDNSANELYSPPNNADSFSNIAFAENSAANRVTHPLSNYDINYVLPSRTVGYTVTYDANDETETPKTVPYEVTSGASHTVKADSDAEIDFQRSGYTFTGWNTLANGQGISYRADDIITSIQADLTLYAQWEEKPVGSNYTITYHANDGTLTPKTVPYEVTSGASHTVKADSDAEIDFQRSGYTFTGWNTLANGQGISYRADDIITSIQADLTLYAQWEEKPVGSNYTITYHANDGTLTPKTVPYEVTSGASHTVKADSDAEIDFQRSGYTFTGWNTLANGQGISYRADDIITSIQADLTLYAQWEEKPVGSNYTITYHANDGTLTPKTVPYEVTSGASHTVKADSDAEIDFQRSGYTFTGWNTLANGQGISYRADDIITSIQADLTLYAQWEEKPVGSNYTITYHANDGTLTPKTVPYEVTSGASHTVKADSDAEIDFQRSGYTFTGWNTLANGQGISYRADDIITSIQADLTLYAQWEEKPVGSNYTITYHANDGTLTPKTVPYEVTSGASHTVKADSDAEIDFQRSGYTFTTWNTLANGQGISYRADDIITSIQADLTLYAQWEEKPVGSNYTVTYHANDGTETPKTVPYGVASGASHTVKADSDAEIDFQRSGYTFTGWNTLANGQGISYRADDIITSIQADLTLYAQWKKTGGGGGGGGGITYYTVTYDANGGQGSHKDSGLAAGIIYTVKSQSATDITHSGHAFTGWNTLKDGKGTAYDPKDTLTIKENVTLYAQWTVEELVPGLNKEDHMAYIVGYPDTTVRPNASITRAETTTIFFRLLTEEFRNKYLSKTNSYWDVAESAWYNKAVSTMASADIITGYEDGSFAGDRFITRAEFAVIAARFDSGSYTGPDKFSDIGTHWANEYINRAAEIGWISGYEDGTFKPDQYISRAEAMTLVNRVLERDKISQMHSDMITWVDNAVGQWYYLAVQEATNSHTYERDSSSNETWTSVLPVPDWITLESAWE